MDKSSVYSRQFLKEHRQQLIQTKLPLEVIEDERNWGYFLDHLDFPWAAFDAEDLDGMSLKILADIVGSPGEAGTEGLMTYCQCRLKGSGQA